MGNVSLIDGHIDGLMADNEIIKALDWCSKTEYSCDMCPYDNKGECMEKLFTDALDLINRQKAELENYKLIAEYQQSVSMDKEFEIKRLKAEVERLKERRDMWRRLAEDFDRITREEDLLKEMVGEDK